MISDNRVLAAGLSASLNNTVTLARHVASRQVRAKCLRQPRFSQCSFTLLQAASARWRFKFHDHLSVAVVAVVVASGVNEQLMLCYVNDPACNFRKI